MSFLKYWILYQIKVYRSHEKELNERRVKTIHSLFHELRHLYYEFNYCAQNCFLLGYESNWKIQQ